MNDARYRGDIEGLRAVAVLLVVLFHGRVAGFDAGFVGVDIFFVISGFLITKSMIEEVSRNGSLSLSDFWARRIRRLLPASLLVFVVSAPFALHDATVLSWSRVGLDLRSAVLYFSNIRFSVNSEDYFAVTDGESFFLHSWSLSLEEQFYVVWPVVFIALLWLARRSVFVARFGLALTLAATMIGSYAISLEMTRRGMAWAFFSLPSRSWELAVGAGLAASSGRLGGRIAAPLSWFGAILLGVGLVVIDSGRPFPGFQGFLPVLGAASLIAGGDRHVGVFQQLLSLRALREIGRVSYTWYLWHWPVFLCIGLRREGSGVWLLLAGLVLSFVLALLTTRFIEEPLRRGPLLAGTRRPLVMLACSVALGASAPMLVKVTDPAQNDPRLVALEAARRDKVHIRGCELWDATPPPGCVFGDRSAGPERTVLLVGDSHAMHWIPALDQMGKANKIRVAYFGFSACPGLPLALLRKNVPFQACNAVHEKVPSVVRALHPAVILSASSAAHWENVVAASDDESRARAWGGGLERLADVARANGATLAVIHDGPHWPDDPVLCLAERGDRLCAIGAALWDRVPAVTRVVELAAAKASGFETLDPRTAICPTEPCSPVDKDLVVKLWDSAHMTSTFSASLAPFFSDRIPPLLSLAEGAK